jgi:hypothetical protein
MGFNKTAGRSAGNRSKKGRPGNPLGLSAGGRFNL